MDEYTPIEWHEVWVESPWNEITVTDEEEQETVMPDPVNRAMVSVLYGDNGAHWTDVTRQRPAIIPMASADRVIFWGRIVADDVDLIDADERFDVLINEVLDAE